MATRTDTTTDMVEVEVPFSGFYESWHNDNIDRAIENHFNYDYDKGEEREVTEAESEAIFMADVDWKRIERAYCAEYVDKLADEFNVKMEFEEMTSPREYNFSTDRIFVKMPRDDINRLRKEAEALPQYAKEIRERFTSYDGFWSFYDADSTSEQWTGDTLDACQYRVMLELLMAENTDDDFELWHGQEIEVENLDGYHEAIEAIDKYLENNKEEK